MKTGRFKQKLRTRNALIEAAWQLLKQGNQPTVAEIADEAMVSRATAYRYFPNRERLLIEAVLSQKIAPREGILNGTESETAASRAARVQEHLYDSVSQNETLFRLLLRSSQEEWKDNKERFVLRADHRLPLLESALEPARRTIDEETFEKLIYALAAMVSVESFVALRDVCQLSKKRGREIMSWAVETLVGAVTKKK